jgi:hypothetical protein
MTEQVKKDEDWMQKKWRPAMGWMYMVVCVFDFVLFPILWAIVQFWETSPADDAFRQWNPLTLQGAGLFHMAMGAVLGIAAFGRTQEKVAGTAVNNIQPPVPSFGGVTSPAFVATPPASMPTTMGGKFAPPPASQPEL